MRNIENPVPKKPLSQLLNSKTSLGSYVIDKYDKYDSEIKTIKLINKGK
jgi:hypothetical protein